MVFGSAGVSVDSTLLKREKSLKRRKPVAASPRKASKPDSSAKTSSGPPRQLSVDVTSAGRSESSEGGSGLKGKGAGSSAIPAVKPTDSPRSGSALGSGQAAGQRLDALLRKDDVSAAQAQADDDDDFFNPDSSSQGDLDDQSDEEDGEDEPGPRGVGCGSGTLGGDSSSDDAAPPPKKAAKTASGAAAGKKNAKKGGGRQRAQPAPSTSKPRRAAAALAEQSIKADALAGSRMAAKNYRDSSDSG